MTHCWHLGSHTIDVEAGEGIADEDAAEQYQVAELIPHLLHMPRRESAAEEEGGDHDVRAARPCDLVRDALVEV